MDTQPTLPPIESSPASRMSLGQVAALVAVVFAFWVLGGVLLLIFFAILVAVTLRGAADALSRLTGLPVWLALVLVTVLLLMALFGLFYWTGPNLYAELADLATRTVAEVDRLRHRFGDNPMLPDPDQLRSLAERMLTQGAQVFSGSLSTATELAVAFVTALYFAGSPTTYVQGGLRLAPIHRRARLALIIRALAHALRMWVTGQLMSMLAVGVLASFGLWIVGVPAPFALGVVAGVFTFVPYVGTIVSGMLAVLIALSISVTTAFWALGVFTLCHLVEGYVVAPLVQKRILDLPPALTLLSMTVLGSLFGLPGIILGTPLSAVLLILVQTLYVADTLGDREVDPTRHVKPAKP